MILLPVFHETDLFLPHNDPDDHYDLACQFALAKKGLTDLKGILIDYPPEGFGDPDIGAVAQLGYLTGVPAPVGVGQASAGQKPGSGLNLLKKVLKDCKEPVTLHIVGSCHDVAEAGRLWPELFREKVKAIYLNAGAGRDSERLEYNVWLDPASFAAIFSLPCPIYWMPCFDSMARECVTGRYGTWWKFRQERLFETMSPMLQNYFLGVLTKRQGADWLSPLEGPVDQKALAFYGKQERNMWCTAGFLHTAGLTVTKSGEIRPLGENPSEEVFSFTPIKVECKDDGHAVWEEAPSRDRFIFTVNDEEKYTEAMLSALGIMLSWLK